MEESLHIRDFQSEDWEAIKILILENQFYGPSALKSEKMRIEFYSQVKEKGRVFIAEIIKNIPIIVGYMVIDFFGRGIFIISLAIAKEYQRKGIGRILVEKLVEFGKEHPQYNIIRTFTNAEFIGAHTFLLKQGFKTCGFVDHDLDFNHSTIHYFMRLKFEEEIEPEKLISA